MTEYAEAPPIQSSLATPPLPQQSSMATSTPKPSEELALPRSEQLAKIEVGIYQATTA